MSENFVIDAFKFRYNALLKLEQEIVQGYEDGVLTESVLNDYRLEIRFLESELQIKDKFKFRTIEDDEIIYLSDDDEYDYNDLPVLKTIKDKSLAELKSTKNLINKTHNGINDNFKSLITEPIDINYSWGKFGKFSIIIRNRDGFINGAFLINEAHKYEDEIRKKLKQEPSKVKKIGNWNKTAETINLIETAQIKIGNDNLMDEVTLNRYAKHIFLAGTYIHPILVNSLATWVSPSYALEINEIINTMNIDAKLKEEEDRTHEILGIKNDIIEQMQRRYNEMDKRHEMLVIDQQVVLRKLDNTMIDLKNTAGRLCNVIGFVEEKKNDIRPTTDDSNVHRIYIYKYHDLKTLEFVTYTCYRTQPSNLQQSLDKASKSLGRVKIFSEPSVNPIQIWKKFKKEYKNNIIANKCDFILKNNYTEKQLKIDLENLLTEYDNIIF